jgi:membrane protein
MHFIEYRRLFTQTCDEWIRDDAPYLGAALAFYSMFSLAPLLLLVLVVADIMFGPDAAQGRIVSEIRDMIGESGAHALQSMVLDSSQKKETGLIANLLGLGILLFGASGVFAALQKAMNIIWDVKVKPGRGLRGFFYDRLLSYIMVLVSGFLLLASVLISAALSILVTYMPDVKFIVEGLNFTISFSIISLLFGLIFKYVPDAHVSWRDVSIGALLTAFLFTVGKAAIGFYIGHSAFTSYYGAAGSLVVILAWVYYSAQILFFGAEFTQVYAKLSGRKAPAKRHARHLNTDYKNHISGT